MPGNWAIDYEYIPPDDLRHFLVITPNGVDPNPNTTNDITALLRSIEMACTLRASSVALAGCLIAAGTPSADVTVLADTPLADGALVESVPNRGWNVR